MPITSAYAAKINQMSGHSRLTSLPSAYTEKASTTAPLAYPPMMAPNPLVIIKNNPWALARMEELVSCSTNNEPEMLKKSNAIPYTIMERISIHRPEPGSPKPNSPNRNTQANILISITCLMPKCLRKNGIARINNVSDICEIDSRITECFTPKESANSGILAKLPRKRSPYVLVICNAAPKSMENRKKIAIFFLLNNTNASSPKEESNVFFSVLDGLHAGRVKEYNPSKSADAPPT